MVEISLQNAQITGFEYKQEQEELLLLARFDASEKYQIVFKAIAGWELYSYGVRNELFSIKRYNSDSLTDNIIEDLDLPEQYIKTVRADPEAFCFRG